MIKYLSFVSDTSYKGSWSTHATSQSQGQYTFTELAGKFFHFSCTLCGIANATANKQQNIFVYIWYITQTFDNMTSNKVYVKMFLNLVLNYNIKGFRYFFFNLSQFLL